jgi:hypothetical protein
MFQGKQTGGHFKDTVKRHKRTGSHWNTRAPDRTIGARKSPFLKSFEVRWSRRARLEARGVAERERGLRDISLDNNAEKFVC